MVCENFLFKIQVIFQIVILGVETIFFVQSTAVWLILLESLTKSGILRYLCIHEKNRFYFFRKNF